MDAPPDSWAAPTLVPLAFSACHSHVLLKDPGIRRILTRSRRCPPGTTPLPSVPTLSPDSPQTPVSNRTLFWAPPSPHRSPAPALGTPPSPHPGRLAAIVLGALAQNLVLVSTCWCPFSLPCSSSLTPGRIPPQSPFGPRQSLCVSRPPDLSPPHFPAAAVPCPLWLESLLFRSLSSTCRRQAQGWTWNRSTISIKGDGLCRAWSLAHVPRRQLKSH